MLHRPNSLHVDAGRAAPRHRGLAPRPRTQHADLGKEAHTPLPGLSSNAALCPWVGGAGGAARLPWAGEGLLLVVSSVLLIQHNPSENK